MRLMPKSKNAMVLRYVSFCRNNSTISKNFLRSKNKVFGPVQIPEKKSYFELFLRFFGVFVPVPNEKSGTFRI
jgi:hypothetical protein